MSKAKLETARALIKDKQYAEARAILLTIPDDPTAQRWLAQLDTHYQVGAHLLNVLNRPAPA